jgi:hypothetical protein
MRPPILTVRRAGSNVQTGEPAPRTSASTAKPKRHHRQHVWKDKHYRWVPDGNGDWRVQGYIFHHHHKPKPGHYRGPGRKPQHEEWGMSVDLEVRAG